MEYNFCFNKDDLKLLNEQANKNGQSFLDYINDIQSNENNDQEEDNN